MIQKSLANLVLYYQTWGTGCSQGKRGVIGDIATFCCMKILFDKNVGIFLKGASSKSI